MGCFLACFGDRKSRRSPKRTLSVGPAYECYNPLRLAPPPKRLTPKRVSPVHSPKKIPAEEAQIGASLPELRENHEQGSFASSRKKVTFDLNVKTYEQVVADEDPEQLTEDDKVNELVKEAKKQEGGEESSSPILGAFPTNHRYQNCEISDEEEGSEFEGDEEDEDDYEDCDLSDDDNTDLGIKENEESYDSYFSLPMDKDKEQQSTSQEVNSPNPKISYTPDMQPTILAKPNARDRSHYVHSVLNPVENLSQWKEVKVRAAPAKNPNKEKVSLEQENKLLLSLETMVKVKKPEGPNSTFKHEISVDASLSTWLVSSENATVDCSQERYSCQSNSSVNREERPILGALTVEDIKKSSVTSSPRKSPSRSPDDMPILGTVGSYWNSWSHGDGSSSSPRSTPRTKGIPNTTSKYREDQRVNWHSTPFEVRLVRALKEEGAA